MARLAPRFLTPKNPPQKVYVGPFFLRVLSQEMRHIHFFLGAQNGGLGWGQKVYVEMISALFPSLTIGSTQKKRENHLFWQV